MKNDKGGTNEEREVKDKDRHKGYMILSLTITVRYY